VLAVVFVALFVIVGLAQGIGNPSVPSGDVALVQDAPNGDITTADFQLALKQTALGQGLKKPPSTSDPQYATLRDTALTDLLTSKWIAGEAQERGISVSDTEISQRLDQIKKQAGGAKGFQQLLKTSGFTLPQAQERIGLMLLQEQLQKEILGTSPPPVSQELIQNFYDANKSQFMQPETRDVREIVNKDQAKVEQAKSILEKDNSATSWKAVASKYSTDKATKANGGLRQGVAQGQSEPALDQQIFAAAQGQLIGPFKGQAGFYLIEVDKITAATTTPLDKISSQIKQQLAQGIQQEEASTFQSSFTSKWVSRTFCATGYVTQQCENFTPPTQTTPGAPPVTSTGAVQPGQTTVFPGQAPPALPQGPQYPAAPAQPATLGPTGAPQLPPGAVPPASSGQTAPPSGAPPAGG
jgi:parvulin-like peptidyl-prolyl isomerase